MTPPLRIVLDTDAFNEVDDQFTIAYAMQSSDALHVEAIYAAPFHNSRSEGPADGMEKSYVEILRVLDLIGRRNATTVLRGADAWLGERNSALRCDAVNDLIERAMDSASTESPLHVVGIAAATNLASALLLEPRIAKRVRYVWLGGQPFYWHTADEFNLRQDVRAAQILFDSGVDLLHVPCKNVAEHLRTCPYELAARLPANSATCNFLRERFEWYRSERGFDTKPLWDIAAIAAILLPAAVTLAATPSPQLTDQKTWRTIAGRHTIHTVTELKRDLIYRDLFAKLATCP